MNPHIYILILNWNGIDWLKSCLDSVLAVDYPNYNTLIIDNNSSDTSGDMVIRAYPQVEYLQLNENYGYAGGYNRCFDYLKDKEPEYILLLNNDTEVDTDILNSFIEAVDYYGKQNIYGAKIFYHHNPQKIWYAGGNIKLKYGMISHRGIRKMDAKEYSLPGKTDYITGCCMFLSWNVMDQLNGFDEDFNMYAEDVDLCLRAKKLGTQCYYWPDAKLRHHVSASTRGHLKVGKLIRKYRSLIKLYFKQI